MMSLVSRISHVEIHTKRLHQLLQQLCTCLDFHQVAIHHRGLEHGVFVANGYAKLLLRQLGTPSLVDENCKLPFSDTYYKNCADRVVGVAFESENLHKFAKNANSIGIKDLYEYTGSQIKAVALKSPSCSHLYHTVIQSTSFDESFLNFEPVSVVTQSEDSDEQTAYIDHIAMACHPNESDKLLLWYEKVFGLARFKVNKQETNDGFVVRYKSSGMNLKSIGNHDRVDEGVKFVFAQSLDTGTNQINTFLNEYGSSGVQHMAIHLDKFVQRISQFRRQGMEFMDPPPTYYDKNVGRLQEMLAIGDAEALRVNGILIDTEADFDADAQCRYLLQVFTKPLLQEQTFFMEFIHRCGATGFGGGNISALWRAVEAYLSR